MSEHSGSHPRESTPDDRPDRVKSIETMMGFRLGKLCEQADAVVLIFGTGCVFLRPEVDDEGIRVRERVECPPVEWTLDFDHPGGKQRVHGLRLKALGKKQR